MPDIFVSMVMLGTGSALLLAACAYWDIKEMQERKRR